MHSRTQGNFESFRKSRTMPLFTDVLRRGVKAPRGRSRYGRFTPCTFVEPYA
ncbi:hypothetical protein H6H01_26450 [Nostoc calcicola FACHB-3891]|nr:hypothetical protein [Nostoc calcicola FACHB-3891]